MSRSSSSRCGFMLPALLAFAFMAVSLPFDIAYAQSAPSGLTVHALDSTIGQPASGVEVELFDISGEQSRSIVKVVTNTEGRANVITDQPLAAGRYELHFAVADYFRKRGVALSDPPFLDVVPVRFLINDPSGNLHLPFVFSPWSYGVFR